MRFSTLAAALLGSVLLAGSGPAQAQLKSITIGTNPAGTTYNVLGGILAKNFQEKLKIRSTAQPHAGSSVYLPLMNAGEITMGLNSSLDSGLAFNGRPPYNSATTNVRSIARIWQLPYGYFVKKNSGIKSIEDLKGKKVVVNFKSNVALQQLNKVIMSTGGLNDGDYEAVSVANIPQAINSVVEGRADASPSAMGIPLLKKAHAGVPGGIYVISLGKMASDEMMGKGMEGSRTMIINPSARNVGVEAPTMIGAFDTFLNVSGNVSDEDAYQIAKTLHESWGELGAQHGVFKGLKPDQLNPATNPIPYHPGAMRYYKEVGLWSEANDKQRGMVMKK